jgi:hypothetical protein
VFDVFPVIINRCIDQNPSQPSFEGVLWVILIKLVKSFHKAVIDDFTSFLPRIGIPQRNAHGIPVKLLIKHFYGFSVPIFGFLDELFFQRLLLLVSLLFKDGSFLINATSGKKISVL